MSTPRSNENHPAIEAACEAITQYAASFAPESATDLTNYLEYGMPGLLDGTAAAVFAASRRLAAEYPVDPRVTEHLEEMAAGLAGRAEELKSVVGTLRTVHEDDLARVENPQAGAEVWDVAISTGGSGGYGDAGSRGSQPVPAGVGSSGTVDETGGTTHGVGGDSGVSSAGASETTSDELEPGQARGAGVPPSGNFPTGGMEYPADGGEYYRPQMDAIDAALNNAETEAERFAIAQTLPGYVTSGGNCHIFRTADDDDNLIKLPRVEFDVNEAGGGDQDPENSPEPLSPDIVMTDYVNPLLVQRGEPNLEQIVSYIPPTEDNRGAVVVQDGGRTVLDLDRASLDAIPPEHFEALIDAGSRLSELELGKEHELGTDNIVYRPDKGFTLIDLQLLPLNAPARGPQEVAGDVTANILVDTICAWETSEELQQPFPEAGRRLLQAYRNRFGDEAAEALRGRAQTRISEWQSLNSRPIYDLPDDL